MTATTRTPADVARLRAELAEARRDHDDLQRRWAVATLTSSSTERPDDLDVELARLDATIAAIEQALAAVGPADDGRIAVDDPPNEGLAKAPGLTQDRFSGAGGYLPSSDPGVTQPERTPTAEPEYLTTREAAALLRISIETLQRMRTGGGGPPWKKVGHRVLYPRAGLLEFGNRQ